MSRNKKGKNKQKIPVPIPEKIPEKVPEKIPEKVPEKVQEKVQEKVPEIIPATNQIIQQVQQVQIQKSFTWIDTGEYNKVLNENKMLREQLQQKTSDYDRIIAINITNERTIAELRLEMNSYIKRLLNLNRKYVH